MKRLLIFCSLTLLAMCSLKAQGQEYAERSPSVIRQTGYHHAGLWAGYGYTGGASCDCSPGCASPCAPAGCGGEICHGYDNCCTCFPGLVCCLKKLGRTLDCLLPCHAFGSGCGACCRPHWFAGRRCGGCSRGCTTSCAPGCSAPCSTCDGPVGSPAAANPFQDDPEAPPVPMPDTNKDARRHPIWKSLATPSSVAIPAEKPVATPFKLTTDRPPLSPRMQAAPKLAAPPKSIAHAQPTPAIQAEPAPIVTTSRRVIKPRPTPATVASQPAGSKAGGTSVLRRASLEEEVLEPELPAASDVAVMQALMPISAEATPLPTIHRPLRQAADAAIPYNPLRR